LGILEYKDDDKKSLGLGIADIVVFFGMIIAIEIFHIIWKRSDKKFRNVN
jgi:hypothetical protein